MYLAIRSDQAEGQVYLLSTTGEIIANQIWPAGRTLARDLLGVIDKLLDSDFNQLSGLIVFAGPGSFTGLRIGTAVSNAIAESLNIPIVGSQSDDWLEQGRKKLLAGENQHIVMPNYGADPNITTPA